MADAMAQPVINEGEVGCGRRRVLGWAQGDCRAGHTFIWRLDISPRWWAEAGFPGRGGRRQEKCVAWCVGTVNKAIFGGVGCRGANAGKTIPAFLHFGVVWLKNRKPPDRPT